MVKRYRWLSLASTLFAMPLAYADLTVNSSNSPLAATQQTGTVGNIDIQPSGIIQPPANNDGIQVNSATASIVIEPNNVNATSAPNAIKASGTGIGINIQAGLGTNAIVTVNSGSQVLTTGTGDAIQIGNTLATLTNSGSILGANAGIHLLNSGTNATIGNLGGTIQGTAAPSILLDAGGSGLTLNNTKSGSSAGLIQAVGAQDAIQINSSFNSISNNTGSTISAVNGKAININAVSSGTIQNAGTITTSGGSQTIVINANFTGTINNNSGGLIQATGAGGNVIFVNNAAFGSINNNAGATISATGADYGINITGGAATGTVNNAGTIQTNATSFFYGVGTNSTGLNNTGTITTTSAGGQAIFSSNQTTVNGIVVNGLNYGIVNAGTISNTGGGVAIDLQTNGPVINIPLLQQGGTITGNVLLASAGGANVFTMTGGTIAGTVFSSTDNASTISISGGTITNANSLNLGLNGNTVNLSGGSLQNINSGGGNNTFNLTGGTFTQLNGSPGDIVNVNASYTTAGTISNVPTINVQNAGTTFTVNNAITGISNQLNVNNGTTMVTNAGVGGVAGTGTLNIQNGGTFTINSGSSVNMGAANNLGRINVANNASLNTTGAYSQSGTFAPTIQDTTASGFGQIVNGTLAAFNPGSIIAPQLGTGSFIPNNTAFPIVQTTSPIVGFGNLTLVQPSSAIIQYRLDNTINPNQVNLIAQTVPLALVATPDIPLSVAASLDPIIQTTTDPILLAFLGQLQLLPDISSVSNALAELAPSYNYALPASSRISMDNAFDSVHARLESMSKIGLLVQDANYNLDRDYELYNGINYGDKNVISLATDQYGAWVKGYGTILDQHKRHNVEGYKAESTGVAFGFDWRPTEFAMVGIAESFTKVNTTDYTQQQNKVNVNTAQTTVYGWFVPYQACQDNSTQTLYFEGMLAVASHKYDTTRNIVVNVFNTQAKGSFYGWQYGAQMDLGYAFVSVDNYLVAPFARFRYTYLNINDYSESNAGGLSLTVQNDDLDETVGGLGIRLALKRDYIQAIYVPEFSFALLYDFSGQAQAMQSNFLGVISDPFYVNSVRPAQYIQQYSAGISAYTSDGYCFTLKGNLEHRQQFFGYNVYGQLTYAWG